MLRDITLGQYYQSDSVIHKLDPRVKLFAVMMFVITLFTGNHYIHLAVAALLLLVLIFISGIPFSYIVRGLRFIAVLLIMSALCIVFFTRGRDLWSYGILHITYEGIQKAIFISIRLVLLILGSSLLTLTTTPGNLRDGMDKSLGFLEKIKIPVHDIAMMMSIALRFIPILMEETDKIMKAQTSRGADFESGGMIRRARALLPLLVPLFIAAFRRANDLATAMDARCYMGGTGRTKMRPLHYERRDYIAYLLIVLYVILMIGIRILMVIIG